MTMNTFAVDTRELDALAPWLCVFVLATDDNHFVIAPMLLNETSSKTAAQMAARHAAKLTGTTATLRHCIVINRQGKATQVQVASVITNQLRRSHENVSVCELIEVE